VNGSTGIVLLQGHQPNIIFETSSNTNDSHRPFTEGFLSKPYLSLSVSDTAEQMALDRLSIKPVGDEEKVLEVLVPATRTHHLR